MCLLWSLSYPRQQKQNQKNNSVAPSVIIMWYFTHLWYLTDIWLICDICHLWYLPSVITILSSTTETEPEKQFSCTICDHHVIFYSSVIFDCDIWLICDICHLWYLPSVIFSVLPGPPNVPKWNILWKAVRHPLSNHAEINLSGGSIGSNVSRSNSMRVIYDKIFHVKGYISRKYSRKSRIEKYSKYPYQQNIANNYK